MEPVIVAILRAHRFSWTKCTCDQWRRSKDEMRPEQIRKEFDVHLAEVLVKELGL